MIDWLLRHALFFRQKNRERCSQMILPSIGMQCLHSASLKRPGELAPAIVQWIAKSVLRAVLTSCTKSLQKAAEMWLLCLYIQYITSLLKRTDTGSLIESASFCLDVTARQLSGLSLLVIYSSLFRRCSWHLFSFLFWHLNTHSSQQMFPFLHYLQGKKSRTDVSILTLFTRTKI